MKRTRIKAVQQSLARNECILPDCDRPLARRGLCKHHYGQFDYQRRLKKTAEARSDFELAMIHEGLVLEVYQQRALRRSNPFSS